MLMEKLSRFRISAWKSLRFKRNSCKNQTRGKWKVGQFLRLLYLLWTVTTRLGVAALRRRQMRFCFLLLGFYQNRLSLAHRYTFPFSLLSKLVYTIIKTPQGFSMYFLRLNLNLLWNLSPKPGKSNRYPSRKRKVFPKIAISKL